MATTTTIPIPVLEIGTWIKADGFSRAYQLNGVRAFMKEGVRVWARQVRDDEIAAWAVNHGAPISEKAAATERAFFERATMVKDGGAYVIEGALQRCKVHGEGRGVCISFTPI